MKNRILVTLSTIMALMFAIGVSSLDSVGPAFTVAVIMTMVPLGWFCFFLLANRGRL